MTRWRCLIGSPTLRSLPSVLARIIHDDFHCNRRATRCRLGATGTPAATRLALPEDGNQAGLPLNPSTYCFKYVFLPRSSASGYPLLSSMQWVQRVTSQRFRHELSCEPSAHRAKPLHPELRLNRRPLTCSRYCTGREAPTRLSLHPDYHRPLEQPLQD